MLLGTQIAQQLSNYFILLVILGNLGVFLCLLLMAYAVAFFGVPWPDRIVRGRLLKWVLRGPISVFVMLALITVAEQLIDYFNAPYQVAIPIISVVSVLLAEHSITVFFPYIEQLIMLRPSRSARRSYAVVRLIPAILAISITLALPVFKSDL